jgi:hypothetical protein
MNAEIALASVLRSVSSSIDELPTEFVAEVLDGVAEGLETPAHVHRIFVSTDAPVKETVAADTSAPSDPVSDSSAAADDEENELGFEYPTSGLVQAGDQWKLKPGLKHKEAGKEVKWREVTPDLVGRPLSDFSKSLIRRPTTFTDLTEGNVAAGDQWKLKDGLRHKEEGKPVVWREVTPDLVGRDVTTFGKSVFRRKV